MYELIILSVLVRGPVHGYVIAQVINDVIGPYARASNGRIYPLLTSLEEHGLISVCEHVESEGGRVSRSFEITAEGRERFRQLMVEKPSKPREYRDLFAFKVSAFDQLDAADRVTVLRHYVDFARQHVRHLELQAADLDRRGDQYGFGGERRTYVPSVFAHLVRVWQREAGWAEDLLADEPDLTDEAPVSRRGRRGRPPAAGRARGRSR